MAAAFVALIGLSLLLLAHSLPGTMRASARTWALASVTLALAWSVVALNGVLPEPATILFGNLFYLTAVVLLYQSVRLFDGLEPRRDLYAKVVALVMAVTLGARYLVDAYSFRVVIMSAAIAFLLSLSAHKLLKRPTSLGNDSGRRVTAVWFIANAGLFVFRVGATVGQSEAPPLLANGGLQTLFLGFGLVSMTGLMFSYFLLYTGRVTAELQRQAHFDVLTGLYNRRAFEARGESEVAHALGKERPLTLLLVDADRFKLINDVWGHAAGDKALCAIADALRANLRAQDTVTRLGGDEFAVLAPGLNKEGAERLARRLEEAVAAYPFAYPVSLSVSIGFVMQESCHDSLSHLLLAADEALYDQKRLRRQDKEKESQPALAEVAWGV